MNACWRHDKITQAVAIASAIIAGLASPAFAARGGIEGADQNSIFWTTDVGYGPAGACRQMVRLGEINSMITALKDHGTTIPKQDTYSDGGVGVIKLFIAHKDGTLDEMVFSSDYGYCVATAASYQLEYIKFIQAQKRANR